MQIPEVIAVHAVPHPEPTVRRVGFPLDHPYVEQCWSAVIGPSCTLFLRRLPVLWRESEPAVVETSELSRSLGLGRNTGYKNSRFWRSVERFAQYGLATQTQPGALEVYVTVRPLTAHQLERIPDWSQRAHHRLLGDHVHQLATEAVEGNEPRHDVSARLDRMERRAGAPSVGLTP